MIRTHRRGYVLLMTLAILAMAATLLVTVGRQAVSRSLAASLADERLQRKWGTITCRTAVLSHAESILKHAETLGHHAAPTAQATIQLTDQNFLIKISDEQAKANVNAMLMNRTQGDVENCLRDALSGLGVINAIRVRPIVEDDTPVDPSLPAPVLPRPIRSFGQVFGNVGPDRLSGLAGTALTRSITLWGDGAVNILRADPAALRVALWPTLSRVEIDRLAGARDQLFSLDSTAKSGSNAPAGATATPQAGQASPRTGAVGFLLSQAQIDPKTASRLTVTDRSTCHSLWILVKDRHRVWYDFAVSDDSIAQQPVRDEFTW